MIRIYFVDDEQQLLDGLQNLLRKQRRVWDMKFLLGGEAALAALAEQPCDILVTDMRMPGMDGAQLLEQVQARYPEVIRMVLSGQADDAQIARTLPVTHQFLSKPCDTETLMAAIERVLAVRAAVTDPSVRAVVGRFAALPSPKGIYEELLRAAASPLTTQAEFGAIIAKDPAMSAKTLQIVNSAFFGLPQHLASIPQAVAYLGVESIKSLSLMANVFDAAAKADLRHFSLEELQRRSLLTAALAQRLVRDPGYAEQAFAAGMLHDIGILVTAIGMPERFRAALAAAEVTGTEWLEIEATRLGVRHAAVGGYILAAWGLPPGVVEAVVLHHDEAPASGAHRHVVEAVRLAQAIGHAVQAGRWEPDGPTPADLRSIGVPDDRIEGVRQVLAARRPAESAA